MAAHKRKMYGNKKKHPSVLIRSAVFLFFSGKQKKKKLQVTCLDRTNIHSNHIIETGVMRWTTTTVGGGCFVSKIEATKTDI